MSSAPPGTEADREGLVKARRWRLLTHPYLTVGVAVLALNFAGIFVVAVVLAVVTERPRTVLCAVGLGFCALKLLPAAAALAAPILGGVTRQDVIDLGALVMLHSSPSRWKSWSEPPGTCGWSLPRSPLAR